jgi:predicted metal-dependent hydrolase
MSVQPTPDDLQIRPRTLNIEADGAEPRWWLGGDPIGTAVLNALSLSFPEGERFFIRSVKQFAAGVPEGLAAEIRAFTIQEGAHTREHIAFNRITSRSGYDVVPLESYVTRRLDIARAQPPLAQLGGTIALEHFTATFAHRLLKDADLLAHAPDSFARLWRWHSIEEIEHKGVAYDVFLHATRDMSAWRRWSLRRWAMALTTLLFTKTVRETALMLLAQDGIKGAKARWGLFRFMWLKPGFYRRMLPAYLAFFRPGFHPWEVDDRGLIAQADADLGFLAHASA